MKSILNSNSIAIERHTVQPSSTTKEAYGGKLRWFNSADGFFCVPRAIRTDDSLTNTEFRILVCLGSFVMLKDEATPSLKTLEKLTGMSEGTISKATSSLEKKGWLRKEQRPYTSVLYHLILPDQFKKETEKQPQQLPLLNEM